MSSHYDVAIVGAGFSGTMVAVNLARRAKGGLRVALVERGPRAGPGLAYGTTDPDHLLNVRARQMGAFPDRVDDFQDWLRRRPDAAAAAGAVATGPDGFAPRLVYGAYLRDVLADARAVSGGIDVLHADVVGLAPGPDGYGLLGAGGVVARARRVVLALGNFPPGDGAGDASADPYSPAVRRGLAEPGDVFLIGTGLTSLDMLVTMARDKREGNIHVLSRRGMFPRVHSDPVPYPPFLDPGHLPGTAGRLLAAVRGEIRRAARRKIAWQDVVDSLRPLNQRIWQALPQAEKRRFLRRVRSYWDTHRHRCAPAVMAACDSLRAQGRLIQHRGAFLSMEAADGGAAVTWRPAGGGAPVTTTVRRAVDCTGPQSDCRRLDDPLVRDLLARDLLAPDPLRLGADTAADGQLRNGAGGVVPGLYTIGPWRRGILGESVAVPELRGQAAALADTLLAGL